MNRSTLDRQDMIREYNHLLKQGIPVEDSLTMLSRVYGSDFDSLLAEFDTVEAYGERNKFDLRLLEGFRDALGSAIADQRLLVLHYRAIIENINNASHSSFQKVSGTLRYLQAVGLVVFMLVVLNETVIQPYFMEVFETLGARPPEMWFTVRMAGFVVAPIALALLIFCTWLVSARQDVANYLRLAITRSHLPYVKRLGFCYRTYVTTSLIRLANNLDVSATEAVDALRQIVAIAYEEDPGSHNQLRLDRVIGNLTTADELNTFSAELAFWEDRALQEVSIVVDDMGRQMESVNMTAMGLFVGLVIIEIYLWIFSMGGAMT